MAVLSSIWVVAAELKAYVRLHHKDRKQLILDHFHPRGVSELTLTSVRRELAREEGIYSGGGRSAGNLKEEFGHLHRSPAGNAADRRGEDSPGPSPPTEDRAARLARLTTAIPVPSSPLDLMSRLTAAAAPTPQPAIVQESIAARTVREEQEQQEQRTMVAARIAARTFPAVAARMPSIEANPLSQRDAVNLLITLGSDIRDIQETMLQMERIATRHGSDIWEHMRDIKHRCGGWTGVLDLSQRLLGLRLSGGEASTPPAPPPPPQVAHRVSPPASPAQAVRDSLPANEELAADPEEEPEPDFASLLEEAEDLDLASQMSRATYTTFYGDDLHIAVAFPPSVRTIRVRGRFRAGSRGGHHRTYRMAFPWMVFSLDLVEQAEGYSPGRLHIGCSDTEPVNLDSRLKIPMLGNTSESGYVCVGHGANSPETYRGDKEDLIMRVAGYFWQSEFNSDIQAIGANAAQLRRLERLADTDPEAGSRQLPTYPRSLSLRELFGLDARARM